MLPHSIDVKWNSNVKDVGAVGARAEKCIGCENEGNFAGWSFGVCIDKKVVGIIEMECVVLNIDKLY